MTEIVEEWLEKAKHDLETANLLLDKKGYPDVVVFHIHQAVEKYLKGFLINKGWKLRKIHDIETLLSEAIRFDKYLEDYLDFGRKLTAFYYGERYPVGPYTSCSKAEAEEMLEIAEELIEKLIAKIG
jgi:HEPN domain-containing protein